MHSYGDCMEYRLGQLVFQSAPNIEMFFYCGVIFNFYAFYAFLLDTIVGIDYPQICKVVAISFYISAAKNGWSRDLLLNAIKMNAYANHTKELSNNFAHTLPEAQASYANEVFRSSYNFGLLGVTEPIRELELEKRLVAKIKTFILELGKGFSLVGNQYRLEYNEKEYFVDMLFFHRGCGRWWLLS